MSAFIVFCGIIAIVFWRAVLKMAAILALIMMMYGLLAFIHGIHEVIR